MIRIEIPGYPDSKLFFALNKTKKEIADFLFEKNVDLMQVVEYITDKTPNVNGKTTLFKTKNIILVRMDYINNSIRYIAILVHEILHASKRIVGELGEEAEAYMLEFLFEEIMKILKPNIDYKDEPRDLEWFEKMTK